LFKGCLEVASSHVFPRSVVPKTYSEPAHKIFFSSLGLMVAISILLPAGYALSNDWVATSCQLSPAFLLIKRPDSPHEVLLVKRTCGFDFAIRITWYSAV
jgi:hypothetical protein